MAIQARGLMGRSMCYGGTYYAPSWFRLSVLIAFDKPVTGLSPQEATQEVAEPDLTVLEKELLIQARRLSRDDLRRLIAQARALAELPPTRPEHEGKTPAQIAQSIIGKSIDLQARKRGKKK